MSNEANDWVRVLVRQPAELWDAAYRSDIPVVLELLDANAAKNFQRKCHRYRSKMETEMLVDQYSMLRLKIGLPDGVVDKAMNVEAVLSCEWAVPKHDIELYRMKDKAVGMSNG